VTLLVAKTAEAPQIEEMTSSIEEVRKPMSEVIGVTPVTPNVVCNDKFIQQIDI
jgi:hypothetical protein